MYQYAKYKPTRSETWIIGDGFEEEEDEDTTIIKKLKEDIIRLLIVSCLLLLVSLPTFVVVGEKTADDDHLISCGGFVKVSKNLPKSKITYDDIKIRLLSKADMRVREETECAPNGYYFLPIYERGVYILQIQGPQGWTFAKNEIEINAQNVDDFKEDINFELTGFQLSGMVSSQDCEESLHRLVSLEGVKVSLKSSSLGVVAETTTRVSGQYVFEDIVPAKDYIVVAQHDRWTFSKNSISVDFAWDNYKVTPDIVIRGFDVTGSITFDNDPMKDVNFHLLSSSLDSIVGCKSTFKPSEAGYKSICSVKSGNDGRFVFSNVPCGKYKLVAQYQGADTKYDIEPSGYEFSVRGGDTRTDQVFEIKGFSVSGRVVNHLKEGISNANILVNGKKLTNTDDNGYYTLEQIKTGTYKIQVEKDHLTFEQLDQKMTPTKPVLPDIIVKTYDVCGQVSVPTPPTGVKVNPREITLQQGKSNEKSEKKLTEANGKFCFQVAPGTYTVSIGLSAQEKSKGLHFVSQSITTTITNKPQLELVFSQTRATVSGRIKPITPLQELPQSLIVTLQPTSRTGEKTNAVLSLSKNGGNDITFTFRDLLPGTYKIIAQNSQWCWSNNEKLIELIDTEEKNDIEFNQNGYRFEINSPHEQVSLTHQFEDQKQQTVALKKGDNEICLQAGKHQFNVKSCFQFEKNSFTVHARGDKPPIQKMVLKIEKMQLDGTIKVEKVEKDLLPSSIDVNVYKSAGGEHTSRTLLTTVKAVYDSLSSLYKFTFMSSFGDQIEFEPVDSKSSTTSKLLFYPQSRLVLIDSNNCLPEIETIVARPGLFIRGKVNPQTANVDITTYKGNDEVAEVTVQTNEKGEYVVGPLKDDAEYTLKASKPGFHFKKESDSNNFNAIQLGSLVVNIIDSVTKQPIQGVLLSVSGEGYRSNLRSPVNGSIGFFGLFPGQYFAKSLLKEYTISPSSLTIDIEQGKQKTIELVATRVAFSVFGSVKSLNGDPQQKVAVQALEGDSLIIVEETTTDPSGSYRLRGLMPGRSYTVRIASSDAEHQGTAIPSSHTVTVAKDDVENTDFIIVAHPSLASFFLSGDVVGVERSQLANLRANLYLQKDHSLYRQLDLGFATFFDFGSIPLTNNYLLRIEHTKIGVISKEIPVGGQGEKSVRHVTVNVQMPQKQQSSSSSHSSSHIDSTADHSVPIAGLSFFVFVVLSVLYPTKVWETLKSIKNGTILKKIKAQVRGNHSGQQNSENYLSSKDMYKPNKDKAKIKRK
ncbi:hypothetical protein DFA_00520 [Cavenderia fasciculata]|uniref:Uncharacterized protein n=1 Tax=Cavenderia fasciculata TaxID=261658 RepID=F4PSB3_CACFS|nr:uncharacterized protein DFA_00520 [Cavenderia fasciculata]EGG20659.1 hypothetical protein DFA_00520 [Cavenderia fasciculata]|eukprot:XP_004358509.1 hypothetical protein DFA_00520 [Cavenderia fasciculata]